MRTALRAALLGLLPAALAGVTLAILVPCPACCTRGPLGAIAWLGGHAPAALAAGLFLLFALLTHHWVSAIPWLAPAKRTERPGSRLRDAGSAVFAVAAAVALAMGLRAKVAESYVVLSGSMLPGLEPLDRIAGARLTYRSMTGAPHATPRRGDVIVFPSASVTLPSNVQAPEVLLKRVIGLPGDRVAMRHGLPVINGWEVPSCDAGVYVYALPNGSGAFFRGRLRVEFLEDRAYLTVLAPADQTFLEPYEVPAGQVFVLGDNRNNSIDSRAWNNGHGGGVPLEAIEARATARLLGETRAGRIDFGRFSAQLDDLRVHAEGMDTSELQAGIARCLAERPTQTSVPAPASEGSEPVSAHEP